uniref:Transmembrane protein n=1 Tax=Medicago truncatula TaxID=3880 RepID=Q2HTD3_MEDTR|nr:hypothetical protein MtrDRAFT_AC150443g38v2 [Medicago truncatula]
MAVVSCNSLSCTFSSLYVFVVLCTEGMSCATSLVLVLEFLPISLDFGRRDC